MVWQTGAVAAADLPTWDTSFAGGVNQGQIFLQDFSRLGDIVQAGSGFVTVEPTASESLEVRSFDYEGVARGGFGDDGILTIAPASRFDDVHSFDDGRLLHAAVVDVDGVDTLIVKRFLSDGSLDPSLDGDGEMVVSPWSSSFVAATPLADGGFFLAAGGVLRRYSESGVEILPALTATGLFRIELALDGQSFYATLGAPGGPLEVSRYGLDFTPLATYEPVPNPGTGAGSLVALSGGRLGLSQFNDGFEGEFVVFNADGTIDASVSGPMSDGRTFVAPWNDGFISTSVFDRRLIAYDEFGEIDRSFGVNGQISLVDNGNQDGVIVRPDGRAIVRIVSSSQANDPFVSTVRRYPQPLPPLASPDTEVFPLGGAEAGGRRSGVAITNTGSSVVFVDRQSADGLEDILISGPLQGTSAPSIAYTLNRPTASGATIVDVDISGTGNRVAFLVNEVENEQELWWLDPNGALPAAPQRLAPWVSVDSVDLSDDGRFAVFSGRVIPERVDDPGVPDYAFDDVLLCGLGGSGPIVECDVETDVYIADLSTGAVDQIEFASPNSLGEFVETTGYDSYDPAISGNGEWISLTSMADLDESDADPDARPTSDIFVVSRLDPDLPARRITRTPDGDPVIDGGAADAPSPEPREIFELPPFGLEVSTSSAISEDGRFVSYVSSADNLIAPIGNDNPNPIVRPTVFLHDRKTEVGGPFDASGQTSTTQVAEANVNRQAFGTAVSNDGLVVSWLSGSTSDALAESGVFADGIDFLVATRELDTQSFALRQPFRRSTFDDASDPELAQGTTRLGVIAANGSSYTYLRRNVLIRGEFGNAIGIRFPETRPDVLRHPAVYRPVVSDPVNVASGALVAAATDLSPPAGAPMLFLERSYDSTRTASGVLGQGWVTNWDHTVEAVGDDIDYISEHGRPYRFVNNGDGTYARPDELFADIATVDGETTISWFNGQTWTFGTDGRIASMRAWNETGIDITRDALGNVITVTSTTGPTLTLEYGTVSNGEARLSTATMSDGRSVTYTTADSQGLPGLLTEVVNPSGTTTYSHDTAGRIVSEVDATGVTMHVTEYNDLGRVARQVLGTGEQTLFSYDDTALTTTVTDTTSGDAVIYRFDTAGVLVSITDPAGNVTVTSWTDDGQSASSTDRLGYNPSATYDANGNVTSTVDPVRGTTSYTYDNTNRVTSVTEPTGSVTTMTYDGDERIPSTVTDGLGFSTNFTVDDGLITTVVDADGITTTYNYDAQRRMTEMTNGLGNSWSYEYDDVGRQTRSTTPLGFETSRTYDDAGRMLTSTAADGGLTIYVYDEDGRMLSTTDSVGAVTLNSYDPVTGLLDTTTDPEGRITTYVYDELSQLVAIEANDGGISETDYGTLGRVTAARDPLGREMTYSYDANGNRTEVVAPDGGVTRTEYDTAGRVTALEDPLGRRTTHTYDDFGRLATVTQADGTTMTYTYDLLGRQIETIAPDGGVTATGFTPAGRTSTVTDPEDGVTTYGYDAAGQMDEITDPNGFVTSVVYDADGRRTAVITPEGLVTNWEYDPMGRITKIIDPAGVELARTYTLRGELETEQREGDGTVSYVYNLDGTMASVADALGNTTTFTYDAAGRQATRVDATGAVEAMEYNTAGELVAQIDRLGQRTEITYDANGRIDTVADPSGRSTDHTYDLAGQLLARTFGDGTEISYTYDDLGRRLSMNDPTGATTYSYDVNGRPIEVAAPNGTLGYDYDLAGRRTGLTYPDGATVTYDYDPAGRLVGLTDPNTGDVDYTLDDDGRLLLTELPNGETREFDFVNGQMVRHEDHSRVTDLTYDESGRIATLSGAQNHTYTYDEAGQLLEAAQDEGTYSYTYGTRGEITSITDPDRTRTFTHNANVEIDTITDGAGATGSVSYDEAGRMVEHTDPNGTITTYAYDARGLLIETTITTPGVVDPDPCAALTPTRTGTEGNDVIFGTWGPDVIFGLGGNDRIFGLSGDDIICGGDGNDRIYGQSDDDSIYGGNGADRIYGSFGDDVINGGEDGDIIYGSSGTDTIQGGNGDDILDGGFGNDTLDGGNDYDIVNGSWGTDTCNDAETPISCEVITNLAGPGHQTPTATATATEPTVSTQSRLHDGSGRLTQVGLDGNQTQLLWDVNKPIEQIVSMAGADGTSHLTYGMHRELNGATQPVYTALGDTWIGDSTSTAPFGLGSESDAIEFGYRGELQIGSSVHLRARNLDIGLGTFQTRDPLTGVVGTTTATNPHHYADNDPINRLDPLGLRPTDLSMAPTFAAAVEFDNTKCSGGIITDVTDGGGEALIALADAMERRRENIGNLGDCAIEGIKDMVLFAANMLPYASCVNAIYDGFGHDTVSKWDIAGCAIDAVGGKAVSGVVLRGRQGRLFFSKIDNVPLAPNTRMSGATTVGQPDHASSNMRKFSNKNPEPGYFDVVGHGSPHDVAGMSPTQLADRIREASGGQNIRLLSCEAGCPTGNFAQDLADNLGVRVMAPTTDISASNSGATLTIHEGGEWRWFDPN